MEQIGKGVVQGMLVAAAYIGMAAQALSCADGVAFACATLALDIANRSKVLSSIDPGIVNKDTLNLVFTVIASVESCADYDVSACLKIGQAGLRVAGGAKMPGPDALK